MLCGQCVVDAVSRVRYVVGGISNLNTILQDVGGVFATNDGFACLSKWKNGIVV